MMGIRINFKVLELKLNQLWAKRGVLNIIDLGHDYYLVTFTSEEDQKTMLLKGPWLIYDHYLTMLEWRSNLCTNSDAIDQLAVWVRISYLPI